MKYTCWGAARQVTGSMHLLEMPSGYTVLIDCGLDYEDHDHNPNTRFPFDPVDIDVVLLTHAHIDHSGNIPNLVKQGFKGEIFCTEPTAHLISKLWVDSVNIQNLERRKRKNSVKLYGHREIKLSMDQLLTLPFNKKFELAEGISFEFYEAGHILGAASIRLSIERSNRTTVIGFTGDLGNYNSTLIVDPCAMPGLDYLVMESTYGNRKHKVQRSPKEELKEYVDKYCVKQAGKLIIPAFSVGRTQAILYTLNQLFESGELPAIKVFADSPLAIASTSIHDRFREYLNADAKSHLAKGKELFDFKNLELIETEEDVEELDYYRDACIIVSSAGMLEGGRIQQHISENIENPMCTVLMAGFCAPGTLGAKLLLGNPILRIKGQDRYVYAKIAQTDVFSAHPDVDGLKRYVSSSVAPEIKGLFLVHGESESMDHLKAELENDHSFDIHIPNKGQSFDL